MIFALNKATWIRLGPQVVEPSVFRHVTEKRDAAAEKDRDAIENQPMEEAGCEKYLNGSPAIYIKSRPALRRKTSYEIGRGSTHTLEWTGDCLGGRNFPMTQYRNWLGSVRPNRSVPDCLVRATAYDDRINGIHELAVVSLFFWWATATSAEPIH